MKILIGGGSGFIGRCLTEALHKKGYEVICVSRTSGAGRTTWTDLERKGLPEDCTAVVNLSGELLMNPLKRWNEKLKSELRSSRIDTNKQLVKAIVAAKSKPKVFISSSAIGFYKPSPLVEYTEDSPGYDTDFIGTLCQEWEESGRIPQEVGVRTTTIRIGLVLGRDGGMIKNMYLPFYLGVGGRFGSGTQWMPWIHVQDCANIIVHGIENDHVTGVLNAVSPNIATNSEFTQTLARAMWRPAIFPMPGFVLNCIFGSERATAMLEGQHVIPKRTLESGYKFIYPDLRSAVEQCVQ